jgi:hypothetical protein
MDLIHQLCKTAVLLSSGRILKSGDAREVSNEYASCRRMTDLTSARRKGDGRARFERVELIDANGDVSATHVFGNPLRIRIHIRAYEAVPQISLAATVCSLAGHRITSSWTSELNREYRLPAGQSTIECDFDSLHLRPGHEFSLMLWMGSSGVIDFVDNALTFRVVPSQRSMNLSPDKFQGSVIVHSSWSELQHVDHEVLV